MGRPISAASESAGGVATASHGMTVSQVPAPRLGDESHAFLERLSAFSGPADFTKTVAVRKGNVVVLLRGTPALVDRRIGTAVARLPSQ